MAVDLATAFIRIVPRTEGMQKSITAAFKDMGKLGETAGKDLSAGIDKTLASGVKGSGKPVGMKLGKDIDSALQAAVKGAGSDAGKEVSLEFDKAASAGAEKAGENFGSKFTGALKGLSFGTLAGVGMQAVQTLTGGMSNLVSEAVSASDATDKFKQTLNFAGLDTSAIDKATGAAQTYADQTVYELADIQNMTAQLAANGIQDYTGLAEAAGNLNAVAGGNAETFKSVGMVMSQTAGQGKLTTENWNQLSDAIPGASGRLQKALEEAGAYTGNFRDAMQKGEITADEFNDAVMKIGSEPVAVEAAESTSTFEGMIGNLQAALSGGLAEAFNQLKPYIETFVNGLTAAAETAIPMMTDALEAAINGTKDFIGFVQDIPTIMGDLAGWVEDNKNRILIAAAAISPVVVPIMMALAAQWTRAGIAATVSAAQQVAAWVSTQAQAVRAGAVMVLNLWKTGAGWIKAGLQATVGAAKIAAAWIIAKGKAGLSLVASIAAVGVGWIKAGAQAMLGAAKMAAAWFIGLGPIAWVTTAVVAVGAALWAFFTKTETGRQMWASFTEFLGQCWEGIKQFFSDGWAKMQEIFSSIGEKVEEVKQFFSGLGESISSGWSAAVDGVATKWGELTGALSSAWDSIQSVFTTGWDALKAGFFFVWDATVTGVKTAWDNVANGLSAAWEMVKQAFQNAWDFINMVVFEPFKAAFSVVRAVFSGDTEGMKAAFTMFKVAIHNAIEAIKGRLNTLVDGFKQIPGKIRSAFANAGNWLVDAGKSIIRGLGDGIRAMGGHIADAIRAVVPDSLERFVPGLQFGGVIPALARGGVLPSVPGVPRSQRDPILGWSTEKKQPVARVEPGEFIVNRDATRKNLPLLAAINNGVVLGKKGDFGLPGYADGGVVGFDDVMKFIRGESVNGKKAPRSLEGAPYVWGGGLLANWGDCSGAMSGIAAFVTGMALAGRKFATMNEGAVLSKMGFKRGTSPGKNAFEVGVVNGGPWGGHTAGTLYDQNGHGTDVEMGGSRGNGQIGGRAAGARHSQFTDRYWTGLSGTASSFSSVDSTSVDGMTVSGGATKSKRSIDWGTVSSLASEWEKQAHRDAALRKYLQKARVYDTGGILPTGGLAVNLGKPEVIWPAEATNAMMQMAKTSPQFARAMDMLATAAPGLAQAMNKLVDVDYVSLQDELISAVQGDDDGYGALASLIGEQLAEKVTTKLAFIGDQVRDMAAGTSMREYFAGLDATDSVKLADRVGSIFGVDGINKTFGGITEGFESMEDAAIGQVDAADAVTQAEKNLAEAREEYAKMLGETPEASKKTMRRIEDAEAAVAKARMSGKADQVAKAEKRLARVREDAADEMSKSGEKSADNLIAAQKAVSEAEDDRTKALGVAKMAAQKTGQAQVEMILQIAESVMEAIEWVSGKVTDTLGAMGKAWGVIADGYKAMGEVAKAVAELRQNVTGLIIDQALAQVQLAAAVRGVRIAQFDSVQAHLDGAKTIAEAQAAFDAQRRADMRLAAANYTDLSLAYDRFRWGLAAGNKDALDQMTAWSDKSHALYSDLLAAQVGQQLVEKKAQQAALEATYKHTTAVLDLQDVTANLQVASKKLAVASGKAFGVDQVGATVGQRYAELVAEKAKLTADQASAKTWLNPVAWGTTMPENQRRIEQINKQLKQLEASKEFQKLDPNLVAETRRIVAKAGAMGFFGMGGSVESMVKNSSIGDAARALDEMEFENSLIDIKAQNDTYRAKIKKSMAELKHREQLNPLETEIEGLKREQDSHKTWAEYWRTDNENIRKSLADLAKFQADAATELKTMAREPAKVVQIQGDQFSGDQLEAALTELGVRVERLENPRPSGAQVAALLR